MLDTIIPNTCSECIGLQINAWLSKMNEKNLIDAKELALQLGISLRKLEYLISEGIAPAFVRIGRARKWRQKDVDDWLEQLFHKQKNGKILRDSK